MCIYIHTLSSCVLYVFEILQLIYKRIATQRDESCTSSIIRKHKGFKIDMLKHHSIVMQKLDPIVNNEIRNNAFSLNNV